jgi:predicted signal transduction protein with EAL and GGDEF domain
VRESDTVARAGGDEFLVVLPGADTTRALLLAGNILNSLGEPIAVEDRQIVVSGSIGISNRPVHSDDLSTLLRFADIAMYRAKREQSGCAIYTSAEDSPAVEHFALVRDLHLAIQQDELVLHYQPQVDIHTGCIRGVEALVRWQHPSRGLVFPDQFIGLAERAGLMKPLTAWVVGEAARQSAAWRARGLAISVTVNLSAENLHDPDLVALIRSSIESHGAQPSSLGVEITETSIMRQPDYALEIIQRLNELGIQIAIDDFGTGYSSLGYLRRFPAHELKIDRSFVLDMSEDENDAVIVSAIIDLGHKLGLRVVAEGVEDQETLDRLIAAGCDIIQGYFVSRPLTAEAVEAWFRHPPPLFAQSKRVDSSAVS